MKSNEIVLGVMLGLWVAVLAKHIPSSRPKKSVKPKAKKSNVIVMPGRANGPV
jgi:hypothetical protein